MVPTSPSKVSSGGEFDLLSLSSSELFAIASFFEVLRSGKYRRARTILIKLQHLARIEDSNYHSVIFHCYQVLNDFQDRHYLQKGGRYLLSKEYSRALKAFSRVPVDRASSFDPSSRYQFLNNKAVALIHLDQNDEGIHHFQAALEENPSPSSLIQLILGLLSADRYREAHSLLKDLRPQCQPHTIPSISYCDLCLAFTLCQLDRMVEAEQVLSRVPESRGLPEGEAAQGIRLRRLVVRAMTIQKMRFQREAGGEEDGKELVDRSPSFAVSPVASDASPKTTLEGANVTSVSETGLQHSTSMDRSIETEVARSVDQYLSSNNQEDGILPPEAHHPKVNRFRSPNSAPVPAPALASSATSNSHPLRRLLRGVWKSYHNCSPSSNSSSASLAVQPQRASMVNTFGVSPSRSSIPLHPSMVATQSTVVHSPSLIPAATTSHTPRIASLGADPKPRRHRVAQHKRISSEQWSDILAVDTDTLPGESTSPLPPPPLLCHSSRAASSRSGHHLTRGTFSPISPTRLTREEQLIALVPPSHESRFPYIQPVNCVISTAESIDLHEDTAPLPNYQEPAPTTPDHNERPHSQVLPDIFLKSSPIHVPLRVYVPAVEEDDVHGKCAQTATLSCRASTPIPAALLPLPADSCFVSCHNAEPSIPTSGRVTYSFAELRAPGPYPSDVDISRREDYLSEEDFFALFSLTRDAFRALPVWKQKAHKRKLSLF